MKKEGNMRINSYNKFFAKVAEIMNTTVKDAKQLDGRYKVELANHVYLSVYRGVCGCLFVHDHRGIERVTSCYCFENFKTMKDLYERLIADYTNEDFIKAGNLKECASGNVFDEGKRLHYMTDDCTKTVLNMEELFAQMFGNAIRSKCKMYNNGAYACPADRKGNRCGGAQWCKQTWKRYAAIVNPEWHHVSLATLAKIDMLDEKRKLVCNINQILKDGICNLYKCDNHISFEVLERYVIRKCDELIRQNRLKAFWFSYIARQLDEVRRNTIYLYTPYITAHRNRW